MGSFAVGQSQEPVAQPTPEFSEQPLSVWESIKAGAANAAQVQRLGAREEATRSAMWERHDAIEKSTGQTLPRSRFMIEGSEVFNPVMGWMDTSDPTGDRAISEWQQARGAGVRGLTDSEYEGRIEKLRQQTPQALAGVQTGSELHAALDRHFRDIAARAQRAAGDHPVAEFAGEAGGSFADPIMDIGTLYTGGLGAGRGLAMRMLTQGAVNAALVASEEPGRALEAKRFGGPEWTPGQAVEDVLGAGAAGAGFELGGTVLSKSFGLGWRLGQKIAPLPDQPALLRAAEVVEAAARDDAAIGPRSGADHSLALDALDQRTAAPLQPFDRDITSIFPHAQPADRGSLVGGVSVNAAEDYRGRPIYSASFDPGQIATDPGRFQYKDGADGAGVTQRLKGVEAWDATAAGQVIVWQDKDGKLFVADGHQRRALALRMEDQGFDARLNGFLLREAEGWSALEARVVAALKNIREGSGSTLDAAKVFRDQPHAINDRSLPLTGDFMAQARGLARLEDGAFRAVINGVIPERYGAEIGALAHSRPDLHEGMVKLMKEADPANLDEARALVVESLQDDWIRSEGETADLFGYDPANSALIGRAKAAAAVKRALARDAKLFGQLIKHADAIETGGNVLARDANEARLAVDRAALELTAKLSLRSGPIGEAMADAAKRITAGETPTQASKGVLALVRDALKAGESLDEARKALLSPDPPAPAAVKLLEDFDQVGGKGAQAQAKAAPEDAKLEAGDQIDLATQVETARGEAVRSTEAVDKLKAELASLEEEAGKANKITDTRGQGAQFHGSRDQIDRLSEGYSNDANIYGGFETLYTTDAADIAHGYFRKSKTGQLYQVREREPIKWFDMEARRTVEEWNKFLKIDAESEDFLGFALDEAAQSNPNPNLREIMDEARGLSRGEGLSRSDVQEYFDGITYELQGDGYGGMRHIGGLLTKQPAHEVKIYFRPHEQVELTPVQVPRTGVPAELQTKIEAKTAEVVAAERVAQDQAEMLKAAEAARDELPAGLFDDIPEIGGEERAHQHLKSCTPGE